MNPVRIFWIFAPLVGLVVLANKLCGSWLTSEELSTLFTGLGFVGVIAAFRHEREQAAGSDRQHHELLAAMERQIAAMADQTRVAAYAAEVQAAGSTAATLTSDINASNTVGESRESLYKKRAPFVARLWLEAEKLLKS